VDQRFGTKVPVPASAEPKKGHPRLQPSRRQRWAFGDPVILSCLKLGEAVLFSIPVPLLLLDMRGILTFLPSLS
jgi:hypothetical protein